MLVSCLISVVFMNPTTKKLDVSQEQLQGKVNRVAEQVYFVDFSKEAKERHYYGDYSDVLVRKAMCSELIEDKVTK